LLQPGQPLAVFDVFIGLNEQGADEDDICGLMFQRSVNLAGDAFQGAIGNLRLGIL
jgi:hypothetical protein